MYGKCNIKLIFIFWFLIYELLNIKSPKDVYNSIFQIYRLFSYLIEILYSYIQVGLSILSDYRKRLAVMVRYAGA